MKFIQCLECHNRFHGTYSCSKCGVTFGTFWPTQVIIVNGKDKEIKYKFCSNCGHKFKKVK
jgi:DNA-directed RNA polymerase subunit RPC12/RpoP